MLIAHTGRCLSLFARALPGARSLAAVIACFVALCPAGPARAESATAPRLRLYVLDCGTLDGLDADTYIPDQGLEGRTLSLAVRCYLIDHPDGLLLWEAGLPKTANTFLTRTLVQLLSAGAEQRVERTLASQLRSIGVSASDVDFLALSHLHSDHAGTANDYAGSVWLVQRAELADAFALTRPVIETLNYAALKLSERIVLDGDYDVFGDGRVVLLSTPGHTPGHMSLLVDLAGRGPILLSGDLYHTRANRELQLPPRINTDRQQTLASMQRIEALAAALGAELWIQHDPEQNRQIPLAPAFLE